MRKMILSFAISFLIPFGTFASPDILGAEKTSPGAQDSQSKTTLSSMTTPQSMGEQLVKYFGRKTGKELMKEKAATSKEAPKLSTQSDVSSSKANSLSNGIVPAVVAPSVKPGYVPPPPSVNPEVSKIRQEIQRILDLNKMIQGLQGNRAVQVQKVQEQARIHQKILTRIETSPKTGESVQKMMGKSVILGQEQLRVVRQANVRDDQMTEAIVKAPEKATSEAAEKVKSSAN